MVKDMELDEWDVDGRESACVDSTGASSTQYIPPARRTRTRTRACTHRVMREWGPNRRQSA